ncbi:conserved hypothetical protein [Theileria equi strain WA]|uniref:Uncharacterized protein n=1 Tax=Theileria equi strain WA TaxID=1537102 RepID=L1LD77_THEEQ|nr:conserved hypothetical protein [Theileria equi strain WA]EKX73229.1 conserved hypothetical protein [Theileria equi strain WA]|eukprot:XP_004832681.1 conserved hypothetical protein [Theileria equi strain WA]
MRDLSPISSYEEIEWPKEYLPLDPVPSSYQIGHCWKVDCIRDELIDSLVLELNKRRKILSHLERRMYNIQDGIKFTESDEDEEDE